MDVEHAAGPGVSLRFDNAAWELAPAVTRARPVISGGMAGIPVASVPGAASQNPDLDWLVATLTVGSDVSSQELPGLVRRPGAPSMARNAAAQARVTVDLADHESAVLLVESEGVVAWQFPTTLKSAPGAPLNPIPVGARAPGSPQSRKLEFVVQPPGAETAITPQQRNVFADWVLDRVKLVVLKFAADRAAGAIVHQLEKD